MRESDSVPGHSGGARPVAELRPPGCGGAVRRVLYLLWGARMLQSDRGEGLCFATGRPVSQSGRSAEGMRTDALS